MRPEAGPLLACGQIPELDCAVPGPRGEHLAIGRNCQSPDSCAVGIDALLLLSRCYVPEFYSPVADPAGQRLAVGRERYRGNMSFARLVVRSNGGHFLAGRQVPELEVPVSVPRTQYLAVRGHGHRQD